MSINGKQVFFQPMAYGLTRMLAAAFRAVGVDAHVLPRSDHRTLELGAQFTGGDECYPARITVGDFLKLLERPEIDPARTVLVMPTADGPCRFGQYATYLRQVLQQNGFSAAEVISPTTSDGYEGVQELGSTAMRTIWRGVVVSDILRKLLLCRRPYEANSGDCDAAYGKSLEDLATTLESAGTRAAPQEAALLGALERARDRFRAIAVHETSPRPLIGIIGEIFCRLNSFANEDLVLRLEALGAECWMSDVSEWVWYTNAEQLRTLRLRGRKCSLEAFGAWVRNRVQHRDERRLLAPFRADFAGREEPGIAEVLENARTYLPAEGAMGEMVINVGRAVALARRGADGIIDISPFTCMNGIVSEAIYPRVSHDLDGIPIRNFYFDGTQTDVDGDAGVFLELANGYRRRKVREGLRRTAAAR